ncbi:MAG: hypothetical protein NTV34_02910, partial [Proteobacteria bacterium]|nr:hypothetical protein [Pseudomonadota bacterium]
MKILLPFHFAGIFIVGCSCSTLWTGKAQLAKGPATPSVTTPSSARVQGKWQSRFEFALAEAGNGAEGLALFADSPMGHTGQQLVIRHPDGVAKLCYAPQAIDDCAYQVLDSQKLQKLTVAANKGDGLSDRPLQTFDTLNLEYVHLKYTDGKIITVTRVFFMVDHKPLPEDYNQLMDTFTG